MVIAFFGGCIYWQDDRYNKWDTKRYSEEVAKKYSASLIDCYNCFNCYDCVDCIDCIDCMDCSQCAYCKDCKNCWDCKRCFNCYNCFNCYDCIDCMDCSQCADCKDCKNCWYCRSCINCLDCNGCSSFSENPERIVGPIIGPENERPTVYWTEVGQEQCIIGCFLGGTLNEFKKALEEKHKDNYELLSQYRKFIKVVRAYQKITK